MRKATLTCTAVALFLSATDTHAQEVAPFKLTDFWAYLELSYRLDQINNQSTGVETDIDDDRRQIELGVSTNSYVYHPKLLQMRIAGSLLSDRQQIVRELTSLPAGNADVWAVPGEVGGLVLSKSGSVTVLDCAADINGDEVVNVQDLLLVVAAFGNAGGPEDINGDGIVNVQDLLLVIATWGPCPSAP